jgi:hypothetical protein
LPGLRPAWTLPLDCETLACGAVRARIPASRQRR